QARRRWTAPPCRARRSCSSLRPTAMAARSPRPSTSRSSSAAARRRPPRATEAMKALENILEAVGHTPLIHLTKVTKGIRTPVYGKAENLNPGSSVKDRIGVAMIDAAVREGKLKPGGTIVEATSGNTGVGLALAAAVRGYRCIFTIPDKMSVEKVR